MKVAQIAQDLEWTPVVAGEDSAITGCVMGDLLSWVLAKGQEGQLWLTVMGNVNVIAVAKLLDFSAVVLCDNAPLDEEAKEQAELHGVALYRCPLPLYETAVHISQRLE